MFGRVDAGYLRWSSALMPLFHLRIRIAHSARYVVRGRVFSSSSNRVVALLRLQLGDAAVRIVDIAEHDRFRRAGLLAGGDNFAVGDRAILLLRSMRASLMRCTQYVHFSITPRLRTVTSGLRMQLRLGVSQSGSSRKLKRRTLYGQLFEQ